ncbi:hypothetical protein SAMN05421636_107229 [Pricia antarctica]|uniref:DUF1508 domain-containing protein n=1 Tax=Pricia antarctica TaxID=641691 RepID=A0A1G7FQD7_9FLAO|nr:YegP family protein [Pricia antarctica]SDE78113.1 hypothetical protein SAMN05421636_107229 [Pricia antarctica]
MINIHTDSDNTHRFSVKTENGNTLLTSVAFPDKTEMDETIKSLGAATMNRNHFERNTNTEGKFLFSLKDDTGGTIGHSEPYDSEAGMENGIKNLREQIQFLG